MSSRPRLIASTVRSGRVSVAPEEAEYAGEPVEQVQSAPLRSLEPLFTNEAEGAIGAGQEPED